MSQPIYLDYNGTTPHDPGVIDAMKPFLENVFGNPSSSHGYGDAPKQAVEKARNQVAGLLNCHPDEIIFTSGGTESNNHAIQGIAFGMKKKGNHIITSNFEHPAVHAVCRFLEKFGVDTTYIPVSRQGIIDPSDVEKAIRPSTILITIMHANNEVGTIQPISDIARLARTHDIVLHTDAAQSAGKIPVNVQKMGVDLLSIAGHKIYAPKGIGALFIKKHLTLEKFCHGAGQEKGRRGGTENVPAIVGLGKACELASQNLDQAMAHMEKLRERLHIGLKHELENCRLNGHPEKRLPNTVSLSFEGVEADRLIEKIGAQVAVSAGAACHSGSVEVSQVLKAMNVPINRAKGTLRFSVGRMTTSSDIDTAIGIVVKAIKAMRHDHF